MMANPLRAEVVRLYKNVPLLLRPPQLLYLGREYPKGGDYFRDRLKAAFTKNKSVQDPEQIKAMIARGEYVARELEALYYLRKYRALKERYYAE
ncbi:LYR motif-containing protein 5B isoform X1 [Girardinichthys multiradiatus]|uniref:LYR motif-containing protein 5B isoform X1 n=1 Tax=Girardinichthys multiradiatus TaxID=208333 RepID=UPI001FACEDE6|nr:LYR motif-containing protein 5B isoform X1 [Girardinichthys multiradiatus]XP_047210805.1 LYR motif-containing protein 5B isoform X1 [Girardinichthys multiradiatus]